MKLRSVFLAAFLMFFSAKTFAGQVEIAQWIPWSFISEELKKIPFSFHSIHESWTMQFGEWTPKTSGAELTMISGPSEIQINETGVQASAQNISAKIAINGLNIDQVIVREINGNQIRIRVQAQCQPFQIQIQSFSVVAQAAFVKQGNAWSPQLSSVQLQIPSPSWTVSPIACQGPQGLDQSIMKLIQDSLSNPASLQEVLKNWLAPQINQLWKANWDSLLAENWQSLKIKSMSEPMIKGFFLRGQIETLKNTQVFLSNQLEMPENTLSPQLLLSTEGFTALAEDNLKNFSVQNFNLQQVPGFQKVMNNRFIQLFVWPDLLHFSRKTPFYLSTVPETTQMSLQSKGSGIWDLTMQTKGFVQVDRKGKSWKYLHWGIGMTAQLQTQVKDSKLQFTTTNSHSNLNWNFDEDYVKAFRPSSRISSSVLQEAGKALFENRTIEKELPVLNLKGRQWKLNGWNQKGSLILMNWKESLP